MAEPTVQELQRQLEDLNKKLKEAGGLGINLQEAFRNAGNDTKKLNEYVNQLNKQYEELTDNVDYVYRTFQDITGELKNQNILLKIGKSSFKGFTDIAQDLNYYQKGTTELTEKQFKKIKQNLELEQKELKFVVERLQAGQALRNQEIESLQTLERRTFIQQARLRELQKENELLFNAKEAIKSGIPILEKELSISKQLSDTRKDLGGIAKAAGKTLSEYGGDLARLLNVGEATEAVDEYNKKLIQGALNNKTVQTELLKIEKQKRLQQYQYEKGLITEEEYLKRINILDKKGANIRKEAISSVDNLGNKFKSLGVFTQELGVGFKKSITDPITLLSFFIGKAFQANAQVVELGKALGAAGEGYRETLSNIELANSNINVTTANLTKAFSELSQVTGFVYKFTEDQLTTQIKLTEQVGLQVDEAAQIQRLAILNGKTSEETYDSFVRGLTAARNQLKVGINFKAALAEATKVSGQLAANLGFNPERIAKAVVQAKALGMTLEQVAKAGDALLNFESSIENELKAELLTGRQLNLERARAAALAGDQVALAEELAKNVGTAADFTKMNVLQQRALAESVGMTADELTNTLRKREEAIASGKSLAQVTAEEAKQAIERQKAQDKFNKGIEKLTSLIGNLLAGPLGMFLDIVSDIFGVVTSIISKIQELLGSGIAKTLIGAIGGFLVGGPIGALIGGIGGAASATMADDMIGYGARTLITPQGAVALNNNDTVIAGTNLFKGDDIMSFPKGALNTGTADFTPMIAAINAINTAIDNLANRPVIIKTDSKVIGSSLVQASPKSA